MRIAFLLFDGVTALDVIGPYEVLSRLPGIESVFVAREPGAKSATGGLRLLADQALSDVAYPEVVVIPGGSGVRALLNDEPILSWLRAAHSRSCWTTSVCTGALLLGAAEILRGLRATTHWRSLELLSSFGAEPVSERVVESGKVITAAGVSAGIDFALLLASRIRGDGMAKAIQLALEYDPRPPFDCGSPEKAGPELVELVRQSAQRAER